MEHKTANLKIRLRPSEYDRLKAFAGKNLSGYTRSALLDHVAGGPSIARELLALRGELSGIGNNINQIARRVNSGESADLTGLNDIINDMRNQVNRKLANVI